MDQAETLRKMVHQHSNGEGSDEHLPELGSEVRVIALSEGMSSYSDVIVLPQLAMALSSLNRKVIVLDGGKDLTDPEFQNRENSHFLFQILVSGKPCLQEGDQSPGGIMVLPTGPPTPNGDNGWGKGKQMMKGLLRLWLPKIQHPQAEKEQ